MDMGEVILVSSRLAFGAIASFLAILLWSKTRDVAWMLMVVATIASYAETVYSILERFGLAAGARIMVGGVPLATLVISNLPTVLYIVAFAVIVARKVRAR